MTVLDTRTLPNGVVRRRRVSDSGLIVITMEVPRPVLFKWGPASVNLAMAEWRRGQDVRERAAILRQQVLARPDWKATAVAHELGCSEARVRQLRDAHAER